MTTTQAERDIEFETKAAEYFARFSDKTARAEAFEGVKARVINLLPDDAVPKGPGRHLTSTNGATIKTRNTRWVWEHLIPLRGLSLLAGEEGLGKTQAAFLLAAEVTRGKLEGEFYGEPAKAIVVTGEDSREETAGPRLRAAGADMSLIEFLDLEEDEKPGELRLPEDAEALGVFAAEEGARLVIIDPLATFLASEINSHNDADVKRALNPLNVSADRHGVAMLGVIHLNKDTSAQARRRFMGSAAFRSTARSTLVWGLDPDDRSGAEGDSRILAHDKHNLTKWQRSFRAKIVGDSYEEGEETVRTSRVVLGDRCDYSANDVLGAHVQHEAASKLKEAKRFLAAELPGRKGDIEEAAKDAGISSATLRRAKEALNVESSRDGFGPGSEAEWALPERELEV
jgi:hypothetical protein